MQSLRVFSYLFLIIVILFNTSCCAIKLKATEINLSKPKILSFSGYRWIVKSSKTPAHPGLNYFSDSSENVWIDKKGQLHLRMTKRNGRWHCVQVISIKNFGYGKYIFYLASRVDQLDKNVVVGLFTFDGAPEYKHREIDIEFSKWGGLHPENGLFVVQGKNIRHRHRFDIQLNGNYSTHSFIWRSQNVFFQSLHGHYSNPPSSNHVIKLWTHAGEDIPPSGNEKARINLWLFKGKPPSDNEEVEVVIKKFEFIPPTKMRE